MSEKKQEHKTCWDSMPKNPPSDPKKPWWARLLDAVGTALGQAMDNRQ